jgi:hypothetical protein
MKAEEYILCAAIWVQDGKWYPHQPKNIGSGMVIAGRRHHNCFATLLLAGEGKKIHLLTDGDKGQGFITNTNRYVDRKEGFKIAKAANQLLNPNLYSTTEENILTSEDLYFDYELYSEDIY